MSPTAADTDPIAVATRFFEELWNGRDLAVADAIFSPDCVTHQLRSAPGPLLAAPRGPDVIKHHVADWLAAFPDLHFDVDLQFAAGELITTLCTMRGTHRGTWLGAAPTNRPVVIRMCLTQRIRGGQIVEDWLVAEWFGVLEQLDVVPPMADVLRSVQAGTRRDEA